MVKNNRYSFVKQLSFKTFQKKGPPPSPPPLTPVCTTVCKLEDGTKPQLYLFSIIIMYFQALLNLGTRDPNLRLAAYNLLCALTTVFHFKIEERLFEGTGMSHVVGPFEHRMVL